MNHRGAAWLSLVLALGLSSLLLSTARLSAVQAQSPTATPPCPASNCPQPRAHGYQPLRSALLPAFRRAAINALSVDGPTYDAINVGLPPAMITRPLSSETSLPLPVLLAVAWQESHWVQFGDTVGASGGTEACTLLSPDCGYGIMQITSCMSDGCGWFDPLRVAGEITYNLGTGVNFLIRKWNHAPFLGGNNPTIPEEWYYAVLAYNGWSTCNDPNRTTTAPGCPASAPFAPDRPPYREGDYMAFRYPYQELVWGWMAFPPDGLWRATRVPPVPRGVFGLRRPDSWQPPSSTPRPQFTLLNGLWVSGTLGAVIQLMNTTPVTQAAEVLLYNADDTFNRRWLGAPPNADHLYPTATLRLPPSSTITVPLSAAFYPWETFQGYARVVSVQGVRALSAHTIFLPMVTSNTSPACTPALQNGGFEERNNGQPAGWDATSNGGYPLADGTRIAFGHLSAHLGGYNTARDVLSQTLHTLTDTQSLRLALWWRTDLPAGQSITDTDRLTVALNTQPLAVFEPQQAASPWQRWKISLPVSSSMTLTLSLEAVTDAAWPTAFFIDEVNLSLCPP